MAPPWFLVKGKKLSGEEVSVRLLLLALLEDQGQTNNLSLLHSDSSVAQTRLDDTPAPKPGYRTGCTHVTTSYGTWVQTVSAPDRKMASLCVARGMYNVKS